MDHIAGLSPNPDSEIPDRQLKPETQTPKRRKVSQEKTVVTVKIDDTNHVGKLMKNEGLPSDFWSWRKYGQKPIKGSPYPRGYYKCSTSKGCSAKKQVERCKTDASMFIITYTSTHNHPGPKMISTTNPTHPQDDQIKLQPSDDQDHHEMQILPTITSEHEDDDGNHEEGDEMEKLEDQSLSYNSHDLIMNISSTVPKSEENDFFDELEELPTIPSFFELHEELLFR